MSTSLDKVLALAGAVTEPAQPTTPDMLADLSLVMAAGSGLAEACALLLSMPASSLSPEMRKAAALVFASSFALDGLALTQGEEYDWVEATALDVTALRLAGGSDSDASKPYGDVPYADPGYQSDGKKRYPLDEKHIHAAIAYFSKSANHEPYTSSQVKSIWSKIKSAASKLGVDMSPDTGKVAATAAMLELASGLHTEMLIKNHKPFHGGHDHVHLHLNDNRHGPGVVGMAASVPSEFAAYNHPPVTGSHGHGHVHVNDATHGPMRAALPQTADEGW
jgi:hypothetical protein